MRKEFPNELQSDTTPLEAGVYVVTGFDIVDSMNFGKVMRLETTKGKFRTTSKAVIGSFSGTIGRIVSDRIGHNESVEVEIIRKKANTGRMGLAVKAFDNPTQQ